MPHDVVFIFVGLLHPRKGSLLLCLVRYFLSFWVGFASGWAPSVASCPMAASVHCPISWTWPPGQSLQWFRTFANVCVPVIGAVTHDHGRSRMIAAAIVLQLLRNAKDFDCFWSAVQAALIFSLLFKAQSRTNVDVRGRLPT
jgi:hypothetical protein